VDLTKKIHRPESIQTAKRLAVEGLMGYQPFEFSTDFEVGVGYEFEEGHYAGLVHYPGISSDLLKSPQLKRLMVAPENYAAFHSANRRLAEYYDFLADSIAKAVGNVTSTTFLDVGCNVGYFPQSFALRGAKLSAGCDRQDFSRSFELLNSILGTQARFVNRWYEPGRHLIGGLEPFDVVMSMAMLCHVSDPLHLLSQMGALARRALFVWSIMNEDENLSCHYGEPRGDYKDDNFPYCFDNMVCPSVPLIRRSMDLMGFREIIEIPPPPGHTGYVWQKYRFRGFLGLR
jgi:SAM-dependent methyltransferase